MALFEFDEGHLIPAQFGRSVPGGLTGDILRCVRQQILEIVGRPLFPIDWCDSDGEQEPRLTALDASGQVVSLEVISELNSATMIDSLSRLADTAALGWNELAAAYPGGIDGFRMGWAEFRAAMPPSPAPGPRLILVVGAIADHVRPALDVLTSSGVEVHEIAVRTMSNGRIFLDVQAVGPRVYGHNPNLLLGNSSGSMRQLGTMPHIDEAVAAQAGGDQPHGDFEPVVGRHAQPPAQADEVETGDIAVETDDSDEPEAADEVVDVVGSEPVAETDLSEAEPVFAPDSFVPDAMDEDGAEAGYLPDADASESFLGEETQQVSMSAPTPLEEPEFEQGTAETETEAEFGTAAEAEHSGEVEESDLGAGAGEADLVEDQPQLDTHEPEAASREEAPVEDAGLETTSVTVGEPVDGAAMTEEPDELQVPQFEQNSEGLQVIASVLGSDTPIYWPSEGLTVKATLTSEGQIRAGHWTTGDPTEAAAIISGASGTDGWQAWRFGDAHGPSLAEALEEINREVQAEYETAGTPQRGRRGR